MTCQLIGGPLDGALAEVEDGIDDDFVMYFPLDAGVAVYGWLFGAADHLDFVGWRE